MRESLQSRRARFYRSTKIRLYANITELDAATLNRLIKEIVVHERIDEDKTRHISIEIHFNLKPIPEVEQVTA